MFGRFLQRPLALAAVCAALLEPALRAADGQSVLTGLRSPATDAEGTHSSPNYRITRWTVENGLPQNAIKAMVQTRDGYLWLGTLQGLARFDGVRFTIFDRNNTPEMSHDSINALAEDVNDGGLWIGTGDGLLYYRDHHFTRYGSEHGIQIGVGNFCRARSGGVWFSQHWGEVGLARRNEVRLCQFGADNPTNTLRQLEEGPSGELFVILSDGRKLYQLDSETKRLTPVDVPTTGAFCLSFFQAEDGSIWLCQSDGIWRKSGDVWAHITSADPKSGFWPQRVYPTRDRQVWVTQIENRDTSLQRLKHGRLQAFTTPEFPAGLNVTTLLEDKEGNLWVGTMTGLFRLEPKRLQVYSRRDGLRNDDVQAVAEGADGTIWVGTKEGVSGIRGAQITNLAPTSVNEPRVGVFLADRENRLWICQGLLGLAVYPAADPATMRALRQMPRCGELRAIFEDREGRMWFGAGTGALCKDDEKWTYLTGTNGPLHSDVRVIHQDRKGDLWFGTFGGGLNRLHEGKFTAYQTRRGDRNNRAWWIHEDVDGIIWVATEDGLNRFVPPELGKSEIRNPKEFQSSKSEVEMDRGHFRQSHTRGGARNPKSETHTAAGARACPGDPLHRQLFLCPRARPFQISAERLRRGLALG